MMYKDFQKENATVENIASKTNKPAPTPSPENVETINIDGDKVLAFIKAIEIMGKILNSLNVVEVKDAFLVGVKCNEVDKILQIQKVWAEVMLVVHRGLGENLKRIEQTRNSHREMLATMNSVAGVSEKYMKSFKNMADFVDTLDRLQKHKESGLLEMVTKL